MNSATDIDKQTISLTDILDEREVMYDELTQQAFTCVVPKLTRSVNNCIEMTEDIEWISMEYVEDIDGFLRVFGLSSVLDKENNEDIPIDAKRMIRLVLPIKLLLDGTEEELTLFIEELGIIAAVAGEEQLRIILTEYHLNDLEKLSNNKNYTDLISNTKKHKLSHGDDFDVNLLTDQQLKSLFQMTNTKH